MNFLNLFQTLPVARVARDHPVTYFDIGSRGGFQEDLAPLAFAVNAVGFEPEPAAYARLAAQSGGPWLSSRFLPFGISGGGGRQTLHIMRDAPSSSLLRPDPRIGARFDKRQFFEIVDTAEIETRTLAEARAEAGTETVDYLKIDIEGGELDVFRSAPDVMDRVLAVKTEVAFLPFRVGQPLAADIDRYLRERGLVFTDVLSTARWRRQGHVIHPHTARETPPYSKGQAVQGDYLYFRDPDTLGGDPAACVRLALIAMALGYFDAAMVILEEDGPRAYLGDRYGADPAGLVGPASRAYGRKVFRAALYEQLRGLVPLLRYARNALIG